MMSDDTMVLRMKGIVKDFPGVRALDHVDFEVRSGEVHALIGENGAGKSTLMNVLAGRFADYAGRISFEGEEVKPSNPRTALALGIGVIFQELSVLPNLTVAENILLGHEPGGRIPWTLNRRSLRTQARAVLEELDFDLPLDTPVGRLSRARQCLVEIAHAIRKNVKLLIFDEPTASLGSDDVERLFEVIRRLKARGIGVVYISHRLAELQQVADRVTVLRDGRAVGTRDIRDCKVSALSEMMLGRKLAEVFPEKTGQPGDVLLRVEGLTRPGVFEDISFELHAGEVLGLAGMVGSGRTEIARAVFGADKADGRCDFKGEPLHRRSPGRSRRLGIGMIQEDRKLDGNVTGLSVAFNAGACILERMSGPAGFVPPRRIRQHARRVIEDMDVRPRDPARSIELLSGGNQQKVIVGRWLASQPEVLILDEPTQGIDVGTKAQIYRLIADLASEGRGILLISSEFIELVSLCDRILVIRNRRIAGERPGSAVKGEHKGADVDSLFEACLGERDT